MPGGGLRTRRLGISFSFSAAHRARGDHSEQWTAHQKDDRQETAAVSPSESKVPRLSTEVPATLPATITGRLTK